MNKIHELEALVLDRKLDIFIIIEANIFNSDEDHELHIPGYILELPKTLNMVGNCRIAALVREGVTIQILDNLMEEHIANIWMKKSSRGRKTVHLGAIYREHRWLRQPEPNLSGTWGATKWQMERFCQSVVCCQQDC